MREWRKKTKKKKNQKKRQSDMDKAVKKLTYRQTVTVDHTVTCTRLKAEKRKKST